MLTLSNRKVASAAAALALAFGVLGATVPSYADNNGPTTSPAFDSSAPVQLGLGNTQSPQGFVAYYAGTPSHGFSAGNTDSLYPQKNGGR